MFDAVRDLVRANYKLQLETKELSVRGWNWGKTEFQGNFAKYLAELKIIQTHFNIS